LSNNNY